MPNQLDRLIDLAEQVGGDAWPYLVEYAWAQGVTNLLGGLVGLVAVVLGLTHFRARLAAALKEDSEMAPLWGILVAVCVTFGTIAFFIHGFNAIPYLLSPEGAALRGLLR